MNRPVASQEEILTRCRRLAASYGLEGLDIRRLAAETGVSVGSIYNRFHSKSELLEAVVESIWEDVFPPQQDEFSFSCTEDCITWLFSRAGYCRSRYPAFFRGHARVFPAADRQTGRMRRDSAWRRLTALLSGVISRDRRASADCFTDSFTAEGLAELVLSRLLWALESGSGDPAQLNEVIRRCLNGGHECRQ